MIFIRNVTFNWKWKVFHLEVTHLATYFFILILGDIILYIKQIECVCSEENIVIFFSY